jgi:Rod binding domain-containing protein
MEPSSVQPKPVLAAAPDREARGAADARATAEAFEAAFLAEMLKHTGVHRTPDGWGGGAGEDAFGGFLTEEYARLIAAQGGIGLAERIFEAIHGGAE